MPLPEDLANLSKDMHDLVASVLNKTKDLEALKLEIDTTSRNIVDAIKSVQRYQVEPLSFGNTFIKRLSGITATKKNATTPDYSFTNPLDKDLSLYSLIFIPDASFKIHGIVEVEKGENKFMFPQNTVGDFTDITQLSVITPQNPIRLRREHKLDFFVWTDNGTASALTIIGFVGDYLPNLK